MFTEDDQGLWIHAARAASATPSSEPDTAPTADESSAWQRIMGEHVAEMHQQAESFAVPGIAGPGIKDMLVIAVLAFIIFQILMNQRCRKEDAQVSK